MVTVYAILRIVYNWIQIAKYERGGPERPQRCGFATADPDPLVTKLWNQPRPYGTNISPRTAKASRAALSLIFPRRRTKRVLSIVRIWSKTT